MEKSNWLRLMPKWVGDQMRGWLFALILLLFPSASEAFSSSEIARRIYQAGASGESYVNAKTRSVIASDILNYWKHFDSKLPRLSNDEIEWVEKEKESNDQIRILNLIESKEHALWDLARMVDHCLTSTKDLINVQNEQDMKSFEMHRWLAVANCYRDSYSNTVRRLQSAGLFEEDMITDGHVLDNLILIQLLDIVIPSAMADTMGWKLSKE